MGPVHAKLILGEGTNLASGMASADLSGSALETSALPETVRVADSSVVISCRADQLLFAGREIFHRDVRPFVSEQDRDTARRVCSAV